MSDGLALDRASVRRKDEDGHLHVSLTPISKANVCGYLGREIPGWQRLGLASDRIYRLWRHPEELEKAVDSFNGKPLLFGHKPVSAQDHDHERAVGSVTGAQWQAPYLMAALDIWPSKAIDAIESGEHEQLSSAYRYIADMTPGTTPEGEKYDGIMREISANHVALVPEGRAGKDVLVHDRAFTRFKEHFSMPKTAVLSRTAATAQGALMAYARPRLAQDAKIDLMPLLKGVNARNIKSKAKAIAAAFDAAVRPKLAQDADMDQADVADIVEQIAEVVAEQSDEIAAKVDEPAPDAADAGPDWDKVSAFLDGKISPEDMDKLKAMWGGDDAEDKKPGNAPAALSAQDKDPKDMVSKTAMDAAIEQARKDAVSDAMAHARAIRDAEHFVRPWVGDLAIAQDSAEGVYRAALDVLKVEHKGKHPDALKDIIAVQRKPSDPVESRRITQDAAPAVVAYDKTVFPNANRLKTGA